MEEKPEETMLIRIKKTTMEKIKKFGEFGESYDTVINKILEDKRKRS